MERRNAHTNIIREYLKITSTHTYIYIIQYTIDKTGTRSCRIHRCRAFTCKRNDNRELIKHQWDKGRVT